MKDMSFFGCLKKELKETIRTNRFLMFILIAVGMAIFALGTLVLMWAMLQSFTVLNVSMPPEMDLIKKMFEMTYTISLSYFIQFMSQFMAVIILIVLSNIMGKEIRDKKWVLPMQAGIKSSTIMISRFIVVIGTVMLAVLIACVFHFLATLILCKPAEMFSAGEQIGQMWYSYAMLMIWILFFTTITCTISALGKRGWITIVVGLIILLVLPLVFSFIPVGGGEYLISYTPFTFMTEMSRYDGLNAAIMQGTINNPMPTALMWSLSSVITALTMAGLIVWSISANTIKAERN